MRALPLLLLLLAHAAWAGEPVRTAVVVGANRAPAGLLPLRYAHRDADKFARVLTQVGGFRDVRVLLDPSPDAVLAAVAERGEALRGRESLLLFYFSGHADTEAIYPGGQALPLQRLRDAIERPGATVRIGFIDACQGGGWTRAKGLAPAAPFEVTETPLLLQSEGSAFIASSSGTESAHESDRLGGSFFTHHFSAGLRGAADRSGDGEVSLTEAFEYAKGLTLRDTARLAQAPQHPSFDLHLRGRQDLVLARVADRGGLLQIEQTRGPLEVLSLSGSAGAIELPRGPRRAQLALPPGRYLVRRTGGDAVYAAEVEVGGGPRLVREDELQRTSGALLSRKGGRPSHDLLTATTVPRGVVELRTGIGVRYRDFSYSGLGLSSGTDRSLSLLTTLTWGVTDRLQLGLGTGVSLAYRLGRRGGVEWVPWGGLVSVGFRRTEEGGFVFGYGLGAGLDLFIGLPRAGRLSLTASALSDGAAGAVERAPLTWRARVSAGYSITLRRAVTLHLSAALDQSAITDGRLSTPDELDLTLRIGSVQTLALRQEPLLRVHLSHWLTLDGYLALSIKLPAARLEETYMAGATLLIF